MTHVVDPICDADLHAYVDDQLDVARRIAVEAYLSRHPSVAARVMSDLRTRDELRLALASPAVEGRPATTDAAWRLQRALDRDRFMLRFKRAASIAVLIAAGWTAHAAFGPVITRSVASPTPPAFVDDALNAHRTAMVRAAMHSPSGRRGYDPDEIRATTAIAVPELPAGWKATDVQIFPSTFGPSVEMTLDAGEYGRLSLFAVRPGVFDVTGTAVARKDDVTAAYWQIGEVAYALAGSAPEGELGRAAEKLARTLY